MINSDIWKNKAVAFVTRSHRHLWGKNNEDPLAFLFLKGLENQLAKEMVLGWNKFGQERPKENWGIQDGLISGGSLYNGSLYNGKFLLPSGIVIPYIVNKKLLSIFIISLNVDVASKVNLVPGSQSNIMILNENNEDQFHPIVMVSNILDGLYLYQETRKKACIIICPNVDDKTDTDKSIKLPVDKPTLNLISKAKSIHYFYYNKDNPTNHKKLLDLFSNVTYHPYYSKEELVETVYRISTKGSFKSNFT